MSEFIKVILLLMAGAFLGVMIIALCEAGKKGDRE